MNDVVNNIILKDYSVSTNKIADKAVTNDKLAEGSVSRSKLNNDLSDLLKLTSFHVSMFKVASSIDNLPKQSNTIGWIVNNHLYLYTKESPTLYTDCGQLRGDTGIQGIQGIQGPKGDKGDKGERGLSGLNIVDIEQPVISDRDEGINIIRITRSDGKVYSFQIKNGSKGSSGTAIRNIEQTTTSTESGGENVITVTMTNGDKYPFSIYNGKGNNNGGYYNSYSALVSAIPNPSTSDWAVVDGNIYICEERGIWKETSYSWKVVGFNDLLTKLNTTSMPVTPSYLYWNGITFNWQNPQVGDSTGTPSEGGSITQDQISNAVKIALNTELPKSLNAYKWWGKTVDVNTKEVKGAMINVESLTGVKYINMTNGTKTCKLELDDKGDLHFSGNFYADGGITALAGATSGDTPGENTGNTNLGTLLSVINKVNPIPTNANEVLTYNGNSYEWKLPTVNKLKEVFSITAGNATTTFDGTEAKSISLIAGNNISITNSDGAITINSTASSSEEGVSLSSGLNHINNYITSNTPSNGTFLKWDGSNYVWATPPTSSSSPSLGKLQFYIEGNKVDEWAYFNCYSSEGLNFKAGNGIAIEGSYTNNGSITTITISSTNTGSSVDLSSYLTISSASSTYLSKTDAASTYLGKGGKAKSAETADTADAATTASKLAKKVQLWGVDFDGSSSINGNPSFTSITIGGVTISGSNGTLTINGNVLATGGVTAQG